MSQQSTAPASSRPRVEEKEESVLTEEEMELLIFTKEEEEFMVVPTWEDSPIRLEDLLSEETFNDLTVDTLQNPSGVFVVDVEQTSGDHSSGSHDVINGHSFSQYNNGQNQHQYPYYPETQRQISYATLDNSASLAKSNGSIIRDLNFENGAFSQPAAYRAQFSQQRQYSELADPTANWVAQTTDVTLLERLVSESDRFRSVDDILDIVPAPAAGEQSPILHQSIYGGYNTQSGATSSTATHTSGSTVLDKNQILEEIYREAEEISSRNASPELGISNHATPAQSDIDFWEQISNSSSSDSPSINHQMMIDSDQSIDSTVSYQPQQLQSVFGNVAKSEKKSKRDELKVIIKKSAVTNSVTADTTTKPPKREAAKQKKRHQNREAALRYRLKKRAERSATNDELSQLLQHNEYLKTQKSNLASEIAYLQGLLSEVHKKKLIRA